jgi:hypothetical protein
VRQTLHDWSRSVKAWIIGVGALAGAIAAVIALAYRLDPSLEPCEGTTTAGFRNLDATQVDALQADVAYTVETHGYRDQELRVLWSLLRKRADGSFRPVPGFAQIEAAVLKPESCSADQGGSDIPVPVAERGSYRVVLELYPPGGGLRIDRASTDFSLGSA